MILLRLFPFDINVLLCFLISSASAFSFFFHQPQAPLASIHFKPIQKWAALGDSYAAGIGAGKRLTGWSSYECSRYNASYPYVLHTQEPFNSTNTVFEYLACSGATSDDILANQISKLSLKADVHPSADRRSQSAVALSSTKTEPDKDPDKDKHPFYDLLTLSSGGNDVGLSDVLNACIFQWSGGTASQCDDQLNQTQHLINTALPRNLDKLHLALIPYLAPGGHFFQTGYAKFFSTADRSCDNVTWSFWYAQYLGWEQQYLTQARRERMNELVDATNAVIEASVGRIRALTGRDDVSARFVDYDPAFGTARGRFCEAGVEEPAPNRLELLFYEWDTTDDEGEKANGPDGLDSRNTTEGSFEGRIVKWIEEGKKKQPQAVARANYEREKQVGTGGEVDELVSVMPDGYLRVFHPRPGGHAIVAKKVLDALKEDVKHDNEAVQDRLDLR